MVRKIMIVLATAAALTGGLTADALARGGGGGGGFGDGGGAHMGGGFSAGHFGGEAFGRGFAGQHFSETRGRFDHDRRFDRGLRFGPGWDYGYYDHGCRYGYPYYNYNPYSCYLPAY